MIAEKSYGVIPLRREDEIWQVYLVCHNAGHWAFPKGHREGEESGQQTAERELNEETGLSIVRFLSSPPIKEQYFYTHDSQKIDKTVVYYLAEVEGHVNLQEEEICDGRWINLHEAQEQITFPEGRSICSQAMKTLLGNKTNS
ncbi:MAG: bis(5'-nucleosidyl)-tetraphosphatase [Chlamydiales bacterium]|jgi:bis(5'-nucleosidyl)-tetraphosphatase